MTPVTQMKKSRRISRQDAADAEMIDRIERLADPVIEPETTTTTGKRINEASLILCGAKGMLDVLFIALQDVELPGAENDSVANSMVGIMALIDQAQELINETPGAQS